MRPSHAKILVVLALFLGLVLESCSKSDGGPPQKTAEQLTAEGWQAYSARSNQDALNRFTEAIQLSGAFVDAYNGQGWANARLNNMSAALVSFTTGLGKDSANRQIKAGLAFVYNTQKNYALSVQKAMEVLAADPSWSFSRDLSVSASDLHLLLAADYFAEGDFTASLTEVQILDSSFPSVDVGTAPGLAALSSEIERLRGSV